jgi:hypothetical protein
MDLFAAHADSMSAPTQGLWRIALVSRPVDNPSPRLGVTSTVRGTIALNGTTNDYELTATTAGVNFMTLDDLGEYTVAVGDELRYNYSTDNEGNEVYDSVTVAAVLSSTRLELVETAPVVMTNGAFKVYRTLDAGNLASKIGLNSGVFASRRVYNIYPDWIESGGTLVRGYYLAAAIAGLIGGVAPHQGLTNVAIAGFDNANKVVHVFNRSQLDSMASAGTWLVVHDLADGSVYTRHELSTDNTDLNTRELMLTKNVDSISYVYSTGLKRFIGRTNVTPSLISRIGAEINSITNYLVSTGFTQELGGQLISASIREIKQVATAKDKLKVILDLVIPYPLNNLELHLVI